MISRRLLFFLAFPVCYADSVCAPGKHGDCPSVSLSTTNTKGLGLLQTKVGDVERKPGDQVQDEALTQIIMDADESVEDERIDDEPAAASEALDQQDSEEESARRRRRRRRRRSDRRRRRRTSVTEKAVEEKAVEGVQLKGKTGKSGGGWQPEACLEVVEDAKNPVRWRPCKTDVAAQAWKKGSDGIFRSAISNKCIKRGSKISPCGRYFIELSDNCAGANKLQKQRGSNYKLAVAGGHCLTKSDPWTKGKVPDDAAVTYSCSGAHSILGEGAAVKGTAAAPKPAVAAPKPAVAPKPKPEATPTGGSPPVTKTAGEGVQLKGKTGKSGGGWQPEACLEVVEDTKNPVRWRPCKTDVVAQAWKKGSDGIFRSAIDNKCIKRGSKISPCGRYFIELSNDCAGANKLQKQRGSNYKLAVAGGHCLTKSDPWTKGKVPDDAAVTYSCGGAHSILGEGAAVKLPSGLR